MVLNSSDSTDAKLSYFFIYKKLKNASPFSVCRNLKYSTTFLYLNSDDMIKIENILSLNRLTAKTQERIF